MNQIVLTKEKEIEVISFKRDNKRTKIEYFERKGNKILFLYYKKEVYVDTEVVINRSDKGRIYKEAYIETRLVDKECKTVNYGDTAIVAKIDGRDIVISVK